MENAKHPHGSKEGSFAVEIQAKNKYIYSIPHVFTFNYLKTISIAKVEPQVVDIQSQT